LEALKIHGKNWENIQRHVGTRDAAHIRSHAQKFVVKAKKMLERSIVAEYSDEDLKYFIDTLEKKQDYPFKKKRAPT
jgi:hypothetical protein